MKNLLLFLAYVLIVFSFACKNSVKNKEESKIAFVDSINKQFKQDSSLLYLDSFQLESFFQKYPSNAIYADYLASFYTKRNNSFAWISAAGINDYAGIYLNLLCHDTAENAGDTVHCEAKLNRMYSKLMEVTYQLNSKDSSVVEFELLLSCSFFEYARRNWGGLGEEAMKKVKWYIGNRKLNYDALLDTVLKKEPTSLGSFVPFYRQYDLLKKYLAKYKAIQNDPIWKEKPDTSRILAKGDTSDLLPAIKKRLFLFGDLQIKDSSNLFNEALEKAIKVFEERHGLVENGIISEKVWQLFRIQLQDRIIQIIINMERCKWIPVAQNGDYVAVNIPDFKMLVYSNSTLNWKSNVIVGKTTAAGNTVIFNDTIESIILNPYWNIPSTIIINETLPSIKKNSNYLKQHNMEIVSYEGKVIAASKINWSNYKHSFPYLIRQRPGKNNALGQVKFIFPNSYSIYLHDTPEKSLFNETDRTFSHGCIRVENPIKLACFLLRKESAWTENKIKEAINSGNETTIRLKNKIPIFITYFTAWVDIKGNLNFRDDVYGHDQEMKKLLLSLN